jgi:hypothetical protein
VKLDFGVIDFEHWKACRLVSNGCIDLVTPRSFGPRIMKCGFSGGPNLFKIFPDEAPGVRIRGGHRLWVAPERKEVTWVVDNDPVELVELEGGLRIEGPVEPSTGLQKDLTIRFGDFQNEVEIAHRIVNRNVWAVELAPWTLTQAAPGGVAFSGFPPRGTHPECLLPTHPLVMWAYTRLADPRWTWGDRFFALRQDPDAAQPQKIGLFHRHAWSAYLLNGQVLFKYATADPALVYPDFGCSVELFTNRFMMELETLGPLTTIPPGGETRHIEHWILLDGVELRDMSDDSIAAALAPALDRIPRGTGNS